MTGFVRGEVLPERVVAPFDAAAVGLYGRLAGDDNALHTDRAVAARLGLPECPVQGMAVMALLEPYLLGWREAVAVTAMSLRFLRPVLIGEPLRLSGRVVAVTPDAKEATLRLLVLVGDRSPAAVGEATVRAPIRDVSRPGDVPAAC